MGVFLVYLVSFILRLDTAWWGGHLLQLSMIFWSGMLIFRGLRLSILPFSLLRGDLFPDAVEGS